MVVKEEAMTKTKRYLARGYNFSPGWKTSAYVGEVRTLPEWINLFWGQKGLDFFKGDTDKNIVEYIREHTGYRLEIPKNGERGTNE